jgi:hypothetical protein
MIRWAGVRGARLWRAVAVLSAALLCALLFLLGPGSMVVLRTVPIRGIDALAAWTRPCVVDTPPTDIAGRVAFCARLDGRVLAHVSASDSGDGERHVLVAGAFHVTLVELHGAMRTPPIGSTVVAIGPLQRASLGLREMIALKLQG